MGSSDLDKALAALRVLRDTCSAAIDALQQPFSDTQVSLLDSTPTCAVLYKDYQSLLTLIYTSTTKVTLVLRPSAPAPSAALAPIKDLGTSITSFATCATLFDLHGVTLASDARSLARQVCEAVRALASMFVDSAGEDYLVRTGTVHDVVEKARRDLPADNIAAVKKRWKADRDMIGDSLDEINAMLEDAEEGEDEAEGGDLDDEWEELGFGTSKKMSEAERECTKKVQPLVRFATLYHKRVVPDVLNGLSTSAEGLEALNSGLDALPSRSHAVVLAVEEVVATLYAPQKPPALAAATSSLAEAIRQIHTTLTNSILVPPVVQETDLAKEMSGLSIEGSNAAEKKVKDPLKWFNSCLAQIDKTAKAVDDMLIAQVTNAT
ncbi:hypothetical protein L226DRAFT_500670 [Lentinus tigrinus ALCF2SS1-7]|uniref:Cyclin-D1-binding protein 1 n=1 Tax=Lentinus tigrinus ALCF2SS1-6 TaxID=1328759 RepID=A0A5C2SR55_9APHY|nr:hypothetical protein L227DRAFT_597575 [Lentinus tigrinus ALCF2SS1-6]RPD80294.1 hypothetical protein L226DRAFT_500670 [Lentinus tigrinus ALCF2SS1-7]